MTSPQEEEDHGAYRYMSSMPRTLPFGSGLHKRTIAFVPASDGSLQSTISLPETKSSQSAVDLYLSIVSPDRHLASTLSSEVARSVLCDVCKLPLTSSVPNGDNTLPSTSSTYSEHYAHANTLAHQVCLPHSHPPSAVDRTRLGLSVLESHGWDPDSRRGLGATGQGIAVPLKPKAKLGNAGIGAVVTTRAPKKEKVKRLDAGKVRKMVKEESKKTDRLRRQLFGNQDLEKYLGPGAV
jgi:hypothetical protein